jgi:simple sugar transport system ATP-binding protein
MTAPPVLEIVEATKTYGGAPAIRNVNFDLRKAELHALAGENGAGKSTLCKALTGAIRLTSGEIRLDGRAIDFTSPAEALRAGIAMVYQDPSLVPIMTVAQNILLGRERPLSRLRTINRQTQSVMRAMHFFVDPTADIATLGAGQKQMVEIARAIYHDARVVIFDEPTATLTNAEKRHFFRLLRSLKARGVSIIYISHAIEESLKVADRISVLRDGELVITDAAANFDREKLVRHMVGRPISDSYYATQLSSRERFLRERRESRPLREVLRVQSLRMGEVVRNMTFTARAGEVTCIAGLIGSGRTEAAKVVSGVFRRDLINGGEVYLEGCRVRYRTPAQAVRDGVVYVTEDRKIDGFFETMDIRRNVEIGWLARFTKFWRLVRSQEAREAASAWTERLRVRALGLSARLIELSGGNQQKVVIAKSLVQKPKLVFFDEPTRGVDVGSIEDIHKFIKGLAEEGVAVVVISSYLPEVLSIADRILVASRGRIVEEMAGYEATPDKIMYAAVS